MEARETQARRHLRPGFFVPLGPTQKNPPIREIQRLKAGRRAAPLPTPAIRSLNSLVPDKGRPPEGIGAAG